MSAAEETSEKTMFMCGSLGGSSEWCRSRSSACVLFSIVHFLLELLGFLLVGEGEAGEAFFNLKAVEIGAILIVAPRVEYFLVPDDTAVFRL